MKPRRDAYMSNMHCSGVADHQYTTLYRDRACNHAEFVKGCRRK